MIKKYDMKTHSRLMKDFRKILKPQKWDKIVKNNAVVYSEDGKIQKEFIHGTSIMLFAILLTVPFMYLEIIPITIILVLLDVTAFVGLTAFPLACHYLLNRDISFRKSVFKIFGEDTEHVLWKRSVEGSIIYSKILSFMLLKGGIKMKHPYTKERHEKFLKILEKIRINNGYVPSPLVPLALVPPIFLGFWALFSKIPSVLGLSGGNIMESIPAFTGITAAIIYYALFHRNWKNIFLVSGIRKLFPEAVISFAFINECLERLERTPPFMRESLYKIFKMEYEKAVNFKFLSNNHKLEMKLLHYSKFDDSLAAKIIEKNVTKRLEKEEKEKIEKKNEAERMYREYLEEHSLPEFLDTGKDD